MSSLNLSPNPGFILAQACVFLANVYAVNRLIVGPYLKLKDKRLAATSGGQEKAAKTRMECDRLTVHIAEQLASVQGEIKEKTKEINGKANDVHESIIAKAKVDAASHLEKLRSDLLIEIQAEREKVPKVVETLVKDTYQALAH